MADSNDDRTIWTCPACGKRFSVPRHLKPPAKCRECKQQTASRGTRDTPPLGIAGERLSNTSAKQSSLVPAGDSSGEERNPQRGLFYEAPDVVIGADESSRLGGAVDVPIWHWFVLVPAGLFLWGMGIDYLGVVVGGLTGIAMPAPPTGSGSRSRTTWILLRVACVWILVFVAYFSFRPYVYPLHSADDLGVLRPVEVERLSREGRSLLYYTTLIQSLLSFMLGLLIAHTPVSVKRNGFV